MNSHKFNGLIAAPYTPFYENGLLNVQAIGGYAEYLILMGVKGVFVCGTTGEWPSLSTPERKLVLEEWLRQGNGNLDVIAHVGSNDIGQSMELARHAMQAGAKGIAMIAPSFFKASTADELAGILSKVAAEAPSLPFYYYHLPSLTGVHVQVSDLFAKAVNLIPNFAGVKYTHSDMFDIQKCISFEGGRYQVMHGFDEILLCGLTLGCVAAVGSSFNYMASVYLEMIDAFSKGEIERARERQLFAVRIVTLLNKYGGSAVAGKAIMKFIGIDCGPNRLPLMTLHGDRLEEFRLDLTHAGFFSI